MLSRYAYTLALIGMALLALPAVLPASISEVNGAKIWIRVAGFSIQPGEFAKICLVVFFAAYLVDKRDVLALASRRVMGLELPRGRDLGPVLLAWVLSILVLVFERDLGSSLLLFGIFVVMLYVATERSSWLLIGVGLFAGGALIAYQIFGHVQARVDTWLDPFAYQDGAGYQLVQSLFGLGTGGLFGAGLGGGRPDQVPVAKSDFIASAVGEELGLFGLVAVIVVYLILVERGLRTSLVVRDAFGKLLAAGPGLRRRLAGVRRPRRRHRPAAADRPDDAVPRLRRLVAGGQLRPGGAAGPDQRRRPPPGRAAGGARRRASATRPPRW